MSQSFRTKFFPQVSAAQWDDWRWQLRNRITDLKELKKYFPLRPDECEADHFAVTPYYLSLINSDDSNDPLRKTVIPRTHEHTVVYGEDVDPLGEEPHRPVSAIIHRYPDRVLFLATGYCSLYCRYCTRSRLVGDGGDLKPNEGEWEKGMEYIRTHSEVRDVLITGGDPLTLSDGKLEWILSHLREIPHVEFIRIGTKVPFVLPQRVTEGICRVLKKYHPLYLSLHVIHPNELTVEAKRACEMLADAGLPLGSHTVLLKGVNDEVATMKRLMHELLKIRVKPYYLFHCDPLKGSSHFRTSVEKGIEIIDGLRGHTTGYAVPHYAIDIPGPGGKVALVPNYVVGRSENDLVVRNYAGGVFRYPDAAGNLIRNPKEEHQDHEHSSEPLGQ